MRKLILLIALCYAIPAISQETPRVKFGKVAAEDLKNRSYAIDTGAAAVILYENGSTQLVGNKKGGFSLQFTMFRRIHILNRTAYDRATLEIPIYSTGEDEEKLDDLKASTYNIEGGKVVETKLGKGDIFREKKSKNWVIRKFTLPNVKEGSIIEYQFQITSEYLTNIQPWNFQSGIPKLWSEYKVELPSFMVYTLISQGDRVFDIYERKDKNVSYSVEQKNDGPYGMALPSDQFSINCGATEFRWAMKNVPAMKEEPYTSTTDNYISRLEFQLAELTKPYEPEKIMTTWADLASRLLKREDFGVQMDEASDWLKAEVNPLIQSTSTDSEKARKIFYYVRDYFTRNGTDEIYTEQSLKNAYKNRSGNVAEINLLLTAMLRTAGLHADPVILSTKDNGFVYPSYPVIGRFNYVITKVAVDGKDVMLDACYPELAFGKLDPDCYNGQARVVDKAATPVSLTSDQLSESETVSVNLVEEKNEGWVGRVKDERGYYGSLDIRSAIHKGGKEQYFKDLAKEFINDVTIEQPSIDSLDRVEQPITLHYDIKFGQQQGDIIYFDPIIAEKYKHNPFKSADRQYPVERPYKTNETYVLTFTVPDGYVVDELPKPITLKLDQSNDVLFEYKISQSGNLVNLRSRLVLNKTNFRPSEYDGLREFFNRVVAKQSEQIVLKKK
jgi:transglutaminase-like putative cysteine protease